TTDAELGGVKIPEGARVMLLYGSANRDESRFDEPDRFDIHRPAAGKHLSFSRGPHFCLGAAMARMEGRIALEVLTRRLPRLRLDDSRSLEHVPHLFLRGYQSLPLLWGS